MVRQSTPLVLSALFACFALVALGLALSWRAADQADMRQLGRENCRAIELLKLEIRREAILDYRRLPRTARLIGIEVTPEVRKAALESRNRTLMRFAPSEC